jgi:hypothetical protein
VQRTAATNSGAHSQVWDLEAGTLYYQSTILCAAALTCVAMDPTYARVAVGAADGVVRLFDLSTRACTQLQVVDVAMLVEKRAAALLSQRDATTPPPRAPGKPQIISSHRSAPDDAHAAANNLLASRVGSLAGERRLTGMRKFANRTIRVLAWGVGQRMTVERWTMPTLSQRTCNSQFGPQSCQRKEELGGLGETAV